MSSQDVRPKLRYAPLDQNVPIPIASTKDMHPDDCNIGANNYEVLYFPCSATSMSCFLHLFSHIYSTLKWLRVFVSVLKATLLRIVLCGGKHGGILAISYFFILNRTKWLINHSHYVSLSVINKLRATIVRRTSERLIGCKIFARSCTHTSMKIYLWLLSSKTKIFSRKIIENGKDHRFE